MSNSPKKKGIEDSSNKIITNNGNNTKKRIDRNSSVYNKQKSATKERLSPRLRQQLYNNNTDNKMNNDIKRNHNHAEDTFPSLQKLSKVSTNNKKPDIRNHQLNNKKNDSTKHIDISSSSLRQNTTNIDHSHLKNNTDYDNYQISVDKKNFKVDQRYSDSNLTNYPPNDKQSYSKQHNNNNLHEYNDHYYSINKCENCQNLISQNDNSQIEINKNESENVNLRIENKYLTSNIENFHSKFDDLNNSNKQLFANYENMKLQNNKFESEIENLKRQNNYLISENEKLNKQYHSLKLENNSLQNLYIERELQKTRISKYESEITTIKHEIESLKSIKENLPNKRDDLNKSDKHFQNEFEIIKSSLKNFEKENENLKSRINKSDQQIEYLRNEVENLLKLVKNFESSKFEAGKSYNNGKSDKSDDIRILSRNQEINNSNSVVNLNQSSPAIKQNLFNNSKQTNFKLKTGPQNNIKSSYSNESVKPIGFENPKGYCFLNCIVQQFYSCVDFREKLVNFHNTSQIAKLNASEKNKFINNFCKLMDEINKRNEVKIKETVVNIQDFFKYSSFGDDVHKCFMNILTVVSDATKNQNVKRSASMPTTPRHSFDMYRNQNDGFVFDLFYGQIAIKLVCSKCAFEFNKRFQLFKSLPLPVPKSRETIPLENVIKNYLEGSPVETDDKINCLCPGGSKNLYSITEYTHMPCYLFIYLNRGSYFENDDKNNTFISCNEILNFPTCKSFTKYRLISVIDHIGDNYGGHYYAKSCFESDQWWMLNDSFVNLIEDKKLIVSKQSIVFLFKKLSG